MAKLFLGNREVTPAIYSGREPEASGDFLVQVVDYDGTVIKSAKLSSGDTFEMPSPPSHEGLVFDGWSSPLVITNNKFEITDSDVNIGPMYHTVSGLSEFDITLATATGLNVTLNMDGTKDWGDGTTDTLTTHTYASAGDYTITCDGSSMTTSSNNGLVGQSYNTNNYYVKEVRFGNNVTSIGECALAHCHSLNSVIIPHSVTSFDDYGTFGASALSAIIIPNSVNSLPENLIDGSEKLKYVVIPDSVTSIGMSAFYGCRSLNSVTIPSSVESMGETVFEDCYALSSVTIPSSLSEIGYNSFDENYALRRAKISEGVTSLSGNLFYECRSLESINIPDTVEYLGSSMFENNYSLREVKLPENENITEIPSYYFTQCYSLSSISIPNYIESIGDWAFNLCYSLSSIKFPPNINYIGDGAFYDCLFTIEYDFRDSTEVPSLAGVDAFNNINKACKIRVPWELCSEWKITTNWIAYADYISGGIPATLNFSITPLNSTIYVDSKQINGNSTTWEGSTVPYVVHDEANNVILEDNESNIEEDSTVNIVANLESYNTITLSTGVSGLDVTFNVGGVQFSATADSNGNYSIGVVGSGTVIGYTINGGSAYMDANGTITSSGSDITQNISLQSAAEIEWVRPNLTSNGTMGGNNFAVSASSANYNAYRAVDGSGYSWSSSSVAEGSLITYTFYNPVPLKVTELDIGSSIGSYWNIVLTGSNNNVLWETIPSIRNGSTINVQGNKFYKYYRLNMTHDRSYTNSLSIGELLITASYKIAAERVNFTITPSNAQLFINNDLVNTRSPMVPLGSNTYTVYNGSTNSVASASINIVSGSTYNISVDLTEAKSITLSTGVSSLSVIAKINGQAFSMTEGSSGDYTINVVGSGDTLTYEINGGSSYMDVTGSITTTGSDITQSVTVAHATDVTWIRPNLTYNGTMGGNTTAVIASSNSSEAFQAMDNSETTYWGSSYGDNNETYTLYNPNALKISGITFKYRSSGLVKDIVVHGSNDNVEWEEVTVQSYLGNLVSYDFTATLSNSKYYKYYKFTFAKYNSYAYICNMTFSAVYKVAS